MSDALFNPHDIGRPNGNYFGFPYTPETCKVLFISVPWDVTTSYGAGTSAGPQAIIDASIQVDLFDFDMKDAWSIGHGTLPIDTHIIDQNKKFRKLAQRIIQHQGKGGDPDDSDIRQKLVKVNQGSRDLNDWIYRTTKGWLERSKSIGLVGGEHSVALGFIKALADRCGNFGILHIDAHADLRKAYEGFDYSHASIMHNALQIKKVAKLVQVGIRDISAEERELARSDGRVVLFDDYQLKRSAFTGVTWKTQCEKIAAQLPEKVYVSFDIDGLEPHLCPNTGTPVPGGLQFQEVVYLLKVLVDSKITIIGFDLCEVAPGKDDEWDANVGARILYKLANFMVASQR